MTRLLALLMVGLLALSAEMAGAEPVGDEEVAEEPARSWTAKTDLSFAVTEGNSATQTLGLKGDFLWKGERNRVRLRLDGLRSDTADDRFRKAVPGVTWEPGEVVAADTTLVEPGIEADTEKYYTELRIDGAVSGSPTWKLRPGRRTWHLGASWDRNRDAGILGRTIAFGGMGNIWWRRDQEELVTNYSVSWTDRQEARVDPEKEESFWGLRGDLRFLDRWGPYMTFDHDTKINWNLEDTSDYSIDMSNALEVPLGGRFSLKVSIQWLYNSEPSLEDIDVIALIEVRDPDGIPGNGDEFFETVEEGGNILSLGTAAERKKSLDTVFRTTLSFSF